MLLRRIKKDYCSLLGNGNQLEASFVVFIKDLESQVEPEMIFDDIVVDCSVEDGQRRDIDSDTFAEVSCDTGLCHLADERDLDRERGVDFRLGEKENASKLINVKGDLV